MAPPRITVELPGADIRIVSASDVIMNMIAAAVVALLKIVPAPREPKAV